MNSDPEFTPTERKAIDEATVTLELKVALYAINRTIDHADPASDLFTDLTKVRDDIWAICCNLDSTLKD